MTYETGCDLSAYRFLPQWEEPSQKPWYVPVIGEQPAPEVEQRLSAALSQGKQAIPYG